MIRHFIPSWLALLLLGLPAVAADRAPLEAFAEAGPGMKRQVLFLPHKEREEEVNFKVELRAGKMFETDGVNHYKLGGSLTRKTLKGWGYHYYEYEGGDTLISTLMGVPDDAPKVDQFISGNSLTLPYNSRLPVVVYLPEGMSVQYRIWTAPREYQELKED